MADTTNNTTENVLVSLKLDLPTTAEQIRALTTEVVGLKRASDELNNSTDASTASRKEAEEALKRQETAARKSQEAMKAEEGSIAALRNQNKELTKERNNTSLATEEGRKRVEELNKQLDKNNATIKENVDAYTKQKIGIGGYTDALDKLVPGLGATVTGIQATTKASLAFIATPIGAVLGALGLAIGAVVAYFKSSEEAQNKWNKITQVGSALLEQLMNVVEDLGGFLVGLFENPLDSLKSFGTFLQNQIVNRFMGLAELIPQLGKAIVLLFQGEFAEAGTVAANAIGKIALGVEDTVGLVGDLIDDVEEMVQQATASAEKAIAMAKRLADVQAEITKRDRELLVESAKTALAVAKLREEAIHQEGEAKMKTIQQAIDLERQLADAQVEQAKRRLEEAQLQVDIAGDDAEALMKVAEAEAAVILAEAERYQATLRFQKEIEAIQDKQEAAKVKAQEDKKKQDTKEKEEQKKNAEAELKAMEEFYARQKKLDADAAAAKKKLDDTQAQQQTDLLATLFGTQKIQYGEAFKLMKKGAIAQLHATTEKAAMEAYASAAAIPVVGFLLGPIAYALAYAKGVASLAAIAGISLGFAGGGQIPKISGTKITRSMGIPITRSNGDDLMVTARSGEVILNERHQAALGGAATFRRIGVPGFADSGAVGTAIQTQQALSYDLRAANAQLVNAVMARPEPILVLQDFEAAKQAKDGAAATAVVVE